MKIANKHQYAPGSKSVSGAGLFDPVAIVDEYEGGKDIWDPSGKSSDTVDIMSIWKLVRANVV